MAGKTGYYKLLGEKLIIFEKTVGVERCLILHIRDRPLDNMSDSGFERTPSGIWFEFYE